MRLIPLLIRRHGCIRGAARDIHIVLQGYECNLQLFVQFSSQLAGVKDVGKCVLMQMASLADQPSLEATPSRGLFVALALSREIGDPSRSSHFHDLAITCIPQIFTRKGHGQLDRRNHIFGVTSPSFTVLLVSPHCMPTPHSLSLHCPASTNQLSSDRFEARESGIQQHGRECP